MSEQDQEKATTSQSVEDQSTYGNQLGIMYKRWVLDCIPDLGHAVSLDYSRRPELYKRVSADAAGYLTEMQSRYGYHPNYPNSENRATLFMPICGASDGMIGGRSDSMFHMARRPGFMAAAGFAENAQPTAFPMHRERIRSSIVPLRRYLEDLAGRSFSHTNSRTRAVFDISALILREPDVAAVFGINERIDEKWPLESTSSEGAKLVEKATTQLPNIPGGVVTRDRFVRLQRIAKKGHLSIAKILDTAIETDDEALDQLTAQLYAWGSDLGLVGGSRPQ